jgi:hypothetical protein
MATSFQVGVREPAEQITQTAAELGPFFSIRDLAKRWRCSRASVCNQIRGEKVLDFATNGRKGHKLVPLEVVLKIERSRLRILR